MATPGPPLPGHRAGRCEMQITRAAESDDMQEGLLIAFEGLDGAGLTTQAERAKENLEDETPWETYLTKEPTDGPAGAQIRMGLSGRVEFDPQTLALLFATDRIDHLNQDVIPKLEDGVIVLLDRYYLSSFAYQMTEPDVDIEWLRAINSKCRTPDLTIFLDVKPQVCLRRMKRERWHVELYEKEAELREVYRNYEQMVEVLRDEEGEDIRRIDGYDDKDVVEERVMSHVREKVDEHNGDG